MTCCSFFLRSLGLSFSVYLSNRIGAEAMGIYHLILSVYFFSVTLATSGIGLTVTKLVSEELAQNSRATVRPLLKKALRYCLFFSTGAIFLIVCLAPYFVRTVFYGKITATPFYILAAGLPFISVSSALSGYFVAMRKSAKTSFAQTMEQLIKMGFTVCMLSFADGSDFTHISCILVVSGTIAEILSCTFYYLAYRFEERKILIRTQDGQWRRILSFSIPIAVSSYLRSGLSSVKQLLIPNRLTVSGIQSGVAEYGRVNGMIFPILMFPQAMLSSFASLIVPEITEKHTLRQHRSLSNILSKIFQVTLLFSVAVAGILLRFSEKLCLFFYGNTDIAPYLKLLAPLVLIMYLDDIVDAVLKGMNCQVTVVRINILDSAVGICLLWWLLPVCGIRGYLSVIAVGEILNGTLSIITLIRHTDCTFGLVRNIFFPSIVIAIATWCANVLCPNGLWSAIAITVLLYVCLLYATGIVTYEDLKL